MRRCRLQHRDRERRNDRRPDQAELSSALCLATTTGGLGRLADLSEGHGLALPAGERPFK